jgi:Predicted hydrolases or acyltransferases (alpha/beta hydrolase superfamily)
MVNQTRVFNEEYVQINGIQQYFLHYPASPDNEVMLIIHGGPGQSEAPFAYYTERETSEITSVFYDQRGAGKTLRKNPTNGKDITPSQLIADLVETVEYIKKKYCKKKIILSGHSWGSILGLQYTHKHPDNILFYVGAGQIVNMVKGEKEIFDRLKNAAKNNTVDSQKLERITDYPNGVVSSRDFKAVMKTITKMKKKYGMELNMKKIQKIALKSPHFGFADIVAMIRAEKINRPLMEYISTFNVEDVTDYQVPMYFVHGVEDFQVPVSPVREYLATINAPDKELFIIPDAGHICNIDNQEGTLSAMREIFNRHRII